MVIEINPETRSIRGVCKAKDFKSELQKLKELTEAQR